MPLRSRAGSSLCPASSETDSRFPVRRVANWYGGSPDPRATSTSRPREASNQSTLDLQVHPRSPDRASVVGRDSSRAGLQARFRPSPAESRLIRNNPVADILSGIHTNQTLNRAVGLVSQLLLAGPPCGAAPCAAAVSETRCPWCARPTRPLSVARTPAGTSPHSRGFQDRSSAAVVDDRAHAKRALSTV